MQLDLKDIKGGELEQEYSCSLSDFPDLCDFPGDDEPKFSEPLVFKLRLQRTGKFVAVDGRFDVVVGLKCARCLQAFEQPITESFSMTFVPQVKDDSLEDGAEVELDADELGLVPYVDETLELRDPLQEQLLLAIPISPLCNNDCQGLCSECGANLNLDGCDCTRKPFNNKFTMLADLDFKKS